MKGSQIKYHVSSALRDAGVTNLIRSLSKTLSGAEWFLVGGYLRDILLKRPSKDIDMVVRNVPPKKLYAALRVCGQVNLVGRTFGVFKFSPKSGGSAIDIALPRTEHAFGTGGYRDVSVQSDWRLPIEDDLGRRDFTINAMAWNISDSKLIDPFDGATDLKKRVIRAVGKPDLRFREDYSRLLRALRFSCQLGFIIEPVTWRALKKHTRHLNEERDGERIVPFEIIAKELLKAFFADPVHALDLWTESGATKKLMPELLAMRGCPQPKAFHSEGDVWTHTRLALSILKRSSYRNACGERDAEITLAVLFHDIAKPKTISYPKKPGERIRFDGHDAVGADMTRRISERLRLSSYKENRIDIDTERLRDLVRYHLLPLSGDPQAMRATTIEHYYLRDERFGKALLALHYADGAATINAKGQPGLSGYRAMKKRINGLLGAKKTTLPRPLLNGHDIMKILNLNPGPEIGVIMEKLREAQLQGKIKTKASAKNFIRSS